MGVGGGVVVVFGVVVRGWLLLEVLVGVVVVVSGGGWIGGEGDGSADEVFELPAGDAELLAEADGGEVAVAVVGGTPGELVGGRASDAAHGGRLLDGEELLPGVAHGRLLQFDVRVDAGGQRTIGVRSRSEATGSTRMTTSPS